MNLMNILKVVGVLALTFILMFAVAFFLFPHINKDRYEEIITGKSEVLDEVDATESEADSTTTLHISNMEALEAHIAALNVQRFDLGIAMEHIRVELERLDSLHREAQAMADILQSDSTALFNVAIRSSEPVISQARQALESATSTTSPATTTSSPPPPVTAVSTTESAATMGSAGNSDANGQTMSSSEGSNSANVSGSSSGSNSTQSDAEFRENIKSLLNLDEEELAPIVRQMSTNQLLRLYRSGSNMQREKLLRSLTPSQAASLMREVMS